MGRGGGRGDRRLGTSLRPDEESSGSAKVEHLGPAFPARTGARTGAARACPRARRRTRRAPSPSARADGRFAEPRGFRLTSTGRISAVDPRGVDTTELSQAEAPLRPLDEIGPEEVFAVDSVAALDVPADEPPDGWSSSAGVQAILGEPDFDFSGELRGLASTAGPSRSRIRRSTCPGHARSNAFTGVLPELARAGLARLVKLAVIRHLAGSASVPRHGNDEDERADARRQRAPRLPRRTAPTTTTCVDAERERLARERGQHLRRDPERRRHVAGVVAVAAVRAAHAGEVAEGGRAGGAAGGEQRLDRPGGGLRVGAAPVRQLEAAVRGSGGGAGTRRRDRSAVPRTPAARSAWIAAAVSFVSAAPPASHDQPPDGRCARRSARRERAAPARPPGAARGSSRSSRSRACRAGRRAAAAAGRRAGRRRRRGPSRRARRRSVAVGLLPREVLGGAARVGAGGGEAERRPGRQLRVAEAAVRRAAATGRSRPGVASAADAARARAASRPDHLRPRPPLEAFEHASQLRARRRARARRCRRRARR